MAYRTSGDWSSLAPLESMHPSLPLLSRLALVGFLMVASLAIGGALGFIIGRHRPVPPESIVFSAAADPDDVEIPGLPSQVRHDPDVLLDGAEELDDYLAAVVALEDANPTIERSYGFQYSSRANRYIAASRMLTNRSIRGQPATQERVLRLRAALDRFADAFCETVDAHQISAAGSYRSVRMDMAEVERLMRLETLRLAALEREGEPAVVGDGEPMDIARMERRLARAAWTARDPDHPEETERLAREARQQLAETLPDLRSALAEWPAGFRRSFGTILDRWVEDYLPPEDAAK